MTMSAASTIPDGSCDEPGVVASDPFSPDNSPVSGDGSALRLATSLPVHPGALTLAFESGRPVALPPFDLTTVDAVTLARSSGATQASISEAAGERRLTIEVDDRRMSHVHAHLRPLAEGWQLEDAGSKNGTRVNGGEIQQTPLRSGDLVEVGRSFFVFRDERPH